MAKNVYDLSEDIYLPEPEDKQKKRKLTPKQRNYAIGLPILGVVLILIGVVYYLAATQWLVDYTTLGYLTYAYATGSDTEATVVAINGSANYPSTFRIPSEINGHKITAIGDNAFVGASRIKKIVMTDNIKSIGSRAFANCTNLETIVFSKNIDSIGTAAFTNTAFEANFPNDDVVVVNDILLNVGEDYFEPNSIILKDEDSQIPSQYASSPVYYFSQIADVNQWMEGLFDGNENLVFVEMPSYLETIPTQSFQNCTNLEGVAFPENVTTIGDYAFADCPNLVDAYVPNTVSSYGAYCFKNTSANISRDLSHVTYIGEGAFQNCLGVTEIVYPAINISSYVFDGCVNLSSLTFTDASKITSIGYSALAKTALTSFTFPKSVQSIDDYVLSECNELETVYMYDNGPVRINARAFYNSSNFKSLLLLDDEGELLDRCVDNNTIYIPTSVTTTANSSTSTNGYVFAGTSIERVEIPHTLRTIGQNLFRGLETLTEVVFLSGENGEESSLTTIEEGAFRDCSNLSSITLPSSVETLNPNIFNGCVSLTNVSFSNNQNIRTIPVGMFMNCTSLETVTLPSGSRFNRINEDAFANTSSLEYLIIPSTIETLEENVIYGVREEGEEKMPIYIEMSVSEYESQRRINEGWHDDSVELYAYSESSPSEEVGEYFVGFWHYDENNNPVKW